MGRERITASRSVASARSAAIISTLAATALACLVLLPLLGHRALADWDEGIYAEVSREMLSGSLLVPHWNAQLWFEKPPLMLWITTIFFKLFGVNEFWARAGSAFSGVAIVGVMHAWLVRRQDRLTAWIATILLLSSFGFMRISRVGEMDALLSLGCLVAVIGLAEVQQRTPLGWYIFWAGFSIALMTKGAASVVLALTLIIAAAPTREIRTHGLKPFLLGFLAFLIAVMPWHLYMVHRFGNSFIANYFGLHVLQRATVQIEGHHTSWWYYLEVLLVSSTPLFLLSLPAIAGIFRDPSKKTFRILAIFALVVFGFFTVVQTRLPHYIAPIYPALAMLAAAWWTNPARRFLATRSTLTKAGFLIAIAAACLVASLATAAPRRRLHALILADGTIFSDNKEAVPLLTEAFAQPQSASGPLLLWRAEHLVPISTDIFYSHRPVQRVLSETAPPDTPRDKYMFDPQPLGDATGTEPRLILLDKALLPTLPPGYTFTLIKASQTMAVGTITRSR